MANPFAKGWKYFTAAIDNAIDENADPQVQIQQAVDAAKGAHKKVFDQAAVVAGTRNQLEMKLNRLLADQEKLVTQARQAISAADNAQQNGDAATAQQMQHTAEVFATQLVAVEQQIEETKQSHAAAVQAADQAQEQVKQSQAQLQETLAQADQLRAQATQAQMQDTVSKSNEAIANFTADDDVPTLDTVRAKIEQRYANALGAQELVQNAVGGQMAGIVQAGNDMKANARLEQIRAELAGEASPAAIEDGKASDTKK